MKTDQRNYYVDTHAHLDFEQFDADRTVVLHNALDAGIVRIINVGTDLSSSERTLTFAETDVHVYASVGVHPHDSAKHFSTQHDTQQTLVQLEHLSKHPKVVALGEIGLDYHYDFSPREVQKHAFEMQLILAQKLNLPVIIHVREAQEDAFAIIERVGYFRGVLHAFAGNTEQLVHAVELGFHIGWGGFSTFKNFDRLETLRATPIDRILLETDCPYLAPHPLRGKRNESANITLISSFIAEKLSITENELAMRTTQNAAKLFGFPMPNFLRTRRQLGQNFLTNEGIAQKIADLSGIDHELVVEIGPGGGAITKHLINRHRKVIAVELDEELAVALEKKMNTQRLLCLHADFLKLDLARLSEYFGCKIAVCGNIPYSITTPILFSLIDCRSSVLRVCLLMQKEVAQRLCAKVACGEYGIPTVLISRYFAVRKLAQASPGSFCPPPKVFSTVIELVPHEEIFLPHVKHDIFSALVHAAFAHRRKLVVSNLRAVFPKVDWQSVFSKCGISLTARAEELSAQQFALICANSLCNAKM